MQVAVIGAGIVGVTTAHELAAQGHEVTVFERRNSVAEEASFAAAGLIGPGHLAPWTGAATHGKALGRLLRGQGPARLRGLPGLAQAPWLWRWWRSHQPGPHEARQLLLSALARLSQQRTQELTRTLLLDHQQGSGCLVLLHSERDWLQAQPGLQMLQSQGLACTVLDAAAARALEPGLDPQAALHTAVHLPQEGRGNCRPFAQQLKAHAARRGAQFRLGCAVQAVTTGARPGVDTASGDSLAFDAVVVCAGQGSAALLQKLGVKLPLAPVVHHTITAPLRAMDAGPDLAPHASVVDPHSQVTMTRLGQRVRVAGRAELGGVGQVAGADSLRPLYRALETWFPGAVNLREAQPWKGVCLTLPDGLPLLGPSGVPGVWLNMGHGAHAWPLAAGSAQVLADLLAGREPPLSVALLARARLR